MLCVYLTVKRLLSGGKFLVVLATIQFRGSVHCLVMRPFANFLIHAMGTKGSVTSLMVATLANDFKERNRFIGFALLFFIFMHFSKMPHMRDMLHISLVCLLLHMVSALKALVLHSLLHLFLYLQEYML